MATLHGGDDFERVISIQANHIALGHHMLSIDKCAQTLVVEFLELKHGQLIYRNVHVHDATAGINAIACKEEIQQFIEDQIELGEEGLDESNHYLLKVNLKDLEKTSGKEQQYWLLQIKAAQSERALKAQQDSTVV